jgi:hypothetical protein
MRVKPQFTVALFQNWTEKSGVLCTTTSPPHTMQRKRTALGVRFAPTIASSCPHRGHGGVSTRWGDRLSSLAMRVRGMGRTSNRIVADGSNDGVTVFEQPAHRRHNSASKEVPGPSEWSSGQTQQQRGLIVAGGPPGFAVDALPHDFELGVHHDHGLVAPASGACNTVFVEHIRYGKSFSPCPRFRVRRAAR